MKVAFIYQGDSNDPNVFSGIPYNLSKYLKKYLNEVILISPIIINDNWFIKYTCKLFSLFCRLLTGKTCLNYYLIYSAHRMADMIDIKLSENQVDLIISPGVDPFVYSKNKIPLVLITGGTVKLLHDDYGNKGKWSKAYHAWLESRSVKVTEKAFKIVCASDYCAESLISDYKINFNKIATIPYGTSFNNKELIHRNVSLRHRVNFLFIGKDWERKGGEDAIKICDCLITLGIDLHLTVVGTKVPEKFQRDYISNHLYLNKQNENDYDILKKLFIESHFFIMPTKAEFFGIVFSEAASFALPVISRRIGPIPEIVKDNGTGILIEKEPDIKYESERIYNLISDNQQYRAMSLAAFNRYLNVLNWDSYMIKLGEIINDFYLGNH